jgi:hypothetical protein
MGQYQTFIVRFWTEDGAAPPRGHVQHIATGHGLYFRDVDRLLAFLHEHLPPGDLADIGGTEQPILGEDEAKPDDGGT